MTDWLWVVPVGIVVVGASLSFGLLWWSLRPWKKADN